MCVVGVRQGIEIEQGTVHLVSHEARGSRIITLFKKWEMFTHLDLQAKYLTTHQLESSPDCEVTAIRPAPQLRSRGWADRHVRLIHHQVWGSAVRI